MTKKNKLILGIIFTIILHLYFYINFSKEELNYKTFDLLQSISEKINTKKHASYSVIIDIDEYSLDKLGQWPWSRLLLTKLIEEIQSNHPSSIGLDILFHEKDKTSPKEIINFYKTNLSKDISINGLEEDLFDNDKIFARQLSKTKTILPIYLNSKIYNECTFNIHNIELQNTSFIKLKSKYALCNIDKLQNSVFNIGFINASSDEDGILRKIPLFIKYKNQFVPSFALANLSSISTIELDKNIVKVLDKEIKLNSDNTVFLHFYQKQNTKIISAYDILINNYNKSDISGKFVLIGSSATGLNDHYKISSNRNIAGVNIHATIIDNILNNDLLYSLDIFSYLNILISFLVSILIIYLSLKHNTKGIIISFFAIFIIFILNIYFLKQGIYLYYGSFFIPFIVQLFIINMIIVFSYFRKKSNFNDELIKAHTSAIDNMVILIENRDVETGEHIRRIKEYAKCITQYLYKHHIYSNIIKKDFIDLIYITSSLHDIGKIAIPDNILQKKGSLTKEEYDIMKKHPVIGKKIIKNSLKEYKKNSFLNMAYNITSYHHEKWDGTGYPDGLVKNEIPLEARIIALVDVYDALISKRCYKEAYSYEYAEKIIINSKATHFDPILVDAFIQIKDKFKEISFKYKD